MILLFLMLFPALGTQAQQPVPTLVPPTLVATATPAALVVAETSGVKTVQEEGVLRIGARYNAHNFSYLDPAGQITGYEVDLMKSVAADLGVQIEWVQVTAENEEELLLTGEVDMLIGQQIHSRDAEQHFEFSHPYYINKQMMVVMQDSTYQSFADLNGQPIGVAMNSRAEDALNDLIAVGNTYDVRRYLSESDALDALAGGEVQAMVGQFDTLREAGRVGMRFIEQPVRLDSYAVRLRRYDVNLRNMINRALQKIYASSGMENLFTAWFRGDSLDFRLMVPKYQGFDTDPRTVNDFNQDMPIPQTSIVDRIAARETLQIAGLSLDPNAPLYDRQLDRFHQALMDEMARRWGVAVNYIPNSKTTAGDTLFSGQAMLAIGITPIWDGADRFDYSQPYFFHGDRMVVLDIDSVRTTSFADLRGGTRVGYWYEDSYASSEITRISEEIRALPSPLEVRSVGDFVNYFEQRTLDGFFGDTLRLQAVLTEASNSGLPFRYLDEWYSWTPLAIAVPRNDAEFVSLINWTLQDMFLDGTYDRIYNETVGFGEPIDLITYPGDGSWLLGQIQPQ